MVIDLSGVLEDGTPRQPGVSDNPRTTLRIPLGADLTLRFRVFLPGGSLAPLVGASLVWTVKKRPSDGLAIVSKPGTVGIGPDTGAVLFSLVPFDTRNVQPGLFCYDIWLTQSGQRNPVMPLSPLIFEAAATPIP